MYWLYRGLTILVGLMMAWYSKKWWFPIAAYVVSCPTRTENLEWYLININPNVKILFPYYKYLSLGNNSNMYWFLRTDTAKKMFFKLVSSLVCLKIEFAKHPLLICWWRNFFGGASSLCHIIINRKRIEKATCTEFDS